MARRRRSGVDVAEDLVESAVGSFVDRLGDMFQRTTDAQKAALPAEYARRVFTCASCRKEFPIAAMEMVHPSNGFGSCKGCFKFMWTAASEKLQAVGRRAVEAGEAAFKSKSQQPKAASAPAKPTGPPPWEALEVSQNATVDEIKKSYRRLAMLWHPDRVPPDSHADEKLKSKVKFEEIQRAYAVMMKVRSAPEVG